MLSALRKANRRVCLRLDEPSARQVRLGARRVFVGLSGGVDSSVAAFLSKKEGYEVIGVHIRGYNVDGCAEDDALMARRAAERLNIPFYVWNMEEEYKKAVVDYMVSAYESGITPNPDVMCNKEIKFGLFYEKAMKLGADFIATGHYALKDDKKSILVAAKDESKDQTYFLWTLDKRIIKKSLFPLGNLLKSEVRKIAAKAGLPNAERKDSQGICFLGKLKMSDFLAQYIKENPGPVVDPDGNVLGTHKGLSFYTLGQRHLGIKGMGGGETLYVAKKDRESNSLVVAPEDSPLLFVKEVFLSDVNFLGNGKEKEIFVRVRYRQPVFKAELSLSGRRAKLKFAKPVKFVAPGQSAVFYSENGEMLGGGVII